MSPQKRTFTTQSPTNTDLWSSETSHTFLHFVSRKLFHQQALNPVISLIIVTVYILQTIAIMIETTLKTFPNSSDSVKDPISSACNLFLGRRVTPLNSNRNDDITFIILVVAYLSVILGITILSFTGSAKVQMRFARVLQYCKSLIQTHFYCLFLPIHNILIEFAIEARNLTTSRFSGFLIIALLALGMNLFLCFLHFLTSSHLQNKDSLALMDQKFLRFSCIWRVIVSSMNLIVFNENLVDEPPMAFNVINLGITICHILILFYTLPFYSRRILDLFVLEAGLLMSFTVINILMDIIGQAESKNSAKNIFFIIFLIQPVYLKFTFNWIHDRISKTFLQALALLESDNRKNTVNRYWFIQSVYHLRDILEIDLAKSHNLKSMLKHYGYVQNLEKYFAEESKIQPLVIKALILWRKKYPRDHLVSIVMTDLMVNDSNMVLDSYLLLQEIMKEKISLTLKLDAYTIFIKIQRIFGNNIGPEDTNGLDLSTFFTTYSSWFTLKKRMLEQTDESNEFYQKVQDKNVELLSIMRFGEKAQALQEKVEKTWSNMSEVTKQSYCSILLVYAFYKVKVNFEYKEGGELIKRYCQLMTNKGHLKGNAEINNETILLPENAIFLVNTAKTEFGNIIYCSNSTLELFGEHPSNLIGKSINTLMPPFIHSIHNSLMMKKLESTNSLLRINNSQSFALDKQGYIFPVNIVTSVFPCINKGLFLAGIVRKIKSKLEYLLIDENGLIDSYSKKIQQKLNLPQPHQGQKVYINEVYGPEEIFNEHSLKACLTSLLPQNKSTSQNMLKSVGSAALFNANHHKIEEKQNLVITNLPTQGTSNLYALNNFVLHTPRRKRNTYYRKPVSLDWKIESKTYGDRVLRILCLQDVLAPRNGHQETQISSSRSFALLNPQDLIQKNTQFDHEDNNENLDEHPEEPEHETSRIGTLPIFEKKAGMEISQLLKTCHLESPRSSAGIHKPSFDMSISQQDTTHLFAQSGLISDKRNSLQIELGKSEANSLFKRDGEFTGRKNRRFPSGITEGENLLASPRSALDTVRSSRQLIVEDQPPAFVSNSDINEESIEKPPQLLTDVTAKTHLNKTRNSGIYQNILKMKYYRFSQAKIPMICLLVSLILLFISSIFVYNISTDTIPTIETIFPVLQNSLDRIIALAEMSWRQMTLAFYMTNLVVFGSMLPLAQQNINIATGHFQEANIQVSRNTHLFSAVYQDFVFNRNIKMYTEDFSNHSSATNYVILNSVEAANLVIDHASYLSGNVNFSSPDTKAHLGFLSENMYNDILTQFQEFPDFIINEINSRVENTNHSAIAMLVATSSLFWITMFVFAGVYLKSCSDTRKFLELFTHFKDKNVESIQHQLRTFRQSLTSSFKDQDLINQFYKNDFSHDRSVKSTTDKIIHAKGLHAAILKRVIVMFLILMVPVVVPIISQQIFSSNFSTITPTLVGMIQPKQIIVHAILTMTEVGMYDTRPNSTINNRNISVVLKENIGNLSYIISEQSISTTSPEYYDLLHRDYCQLVDPKNYTACATTFNRISTSGVTGMILALQSFLSTYKTAIETKTTTRAQAAQMGEAYLMITMANEAIDYVQNQDFSQLIQHLENIETTIKTFIGISIALCIVLSSLGITYVYLPSMKERRNICKLLLMFPSSVVFSNLRLRAFLMRESREFRKILQK